MSDLTDAEIFEISKNLKLAIAASISGSLLAGEYDDFVIAVQDLRQASQIEKAFSLSDDEKEYWGQLVADCDQALSIWEEGGSEPTESVIAALRSAGLEDFAFAAEIGDFSVLAY